MRFGWLLIALTGCDDLFNLERIDRIDAGPDAAAFDPATCPLDYDLGLFAGSRYRLIATAARAWVQSDLCNADWQGHTHLVVFDSASSLEAVAVQKELDASGQLRWWVGAVQRRTALMPGDGWLWMTGAALTVGWDVPVEPDDADMLELDHLEQFVVMQEAKSGLIDITGQDLYNALCECDGRPFSDDARMTVDDNRQ